MAPRSFTAAIVLLPCQMDLLLAGVLTAYFLREPGAWVFSAISPSPALDRWWKRSRSCACYFSFLLQGADFDPESFDLRFSCYSFLLCPSVVVSGPSVGSHLASQMAYGIGKYRLWHLSHRILGFSVATVLLPASPNQGLFAVPLGIVFTIAVAKISWEWFEKPIVRLGHRAVYGNPLKHEHLTPTGKAVVNVSAQAPFVEKPLLGARGSVSPRTLSMSKM